MPTRAARTCASWALHPAGARTIEDAARRKEARALKAVEDHGRWARSRADALIFPTLCDPLSLRVPRGERRVVLGIATGTTPEVDVLWRLECAPDVYLHVDPDAVATAIAARLCARRGVRFVHVAQRVEELTLFRMCQLVHTHGPIWGCVATPPCNMYSKQNMHRRSLECSAASAMHTDDGSVLLTAAALIGEIRRELCPSMWFLLEETASLPPCTQRHIQRLLRCPPAIRLTSSIYSTVRCPRTRIYMTNIDQISDDAPLSRFNAIPASIAAWERTFGEGHTPVPGWEAEGSGALVAAHLVPQLRCVMSETYVVARERLGAKGVPLRAWKQIWTEQIERKENNYNVTFDQASGKVSAWTPQSAEAVMGASWHRLGIVTLLPAEITAEGAARLPSDVNAPVLLTRRLHNRALGRGLHVPTIARLLQPLAGRGEG